MITLMQEIDRLKSNKESSPPTWCHQDDITILQYYILVLLPLMNLLFCKKGWIRCAPPLSWLEYSIFSSFKSVFVKVQVKATHVSAQKMTNKVKYWTSLLNRDESPTVRSILSIFPFTLTKCPTVWSFQAIFKKFQPLSCQQKCS